MISGANARCLLQRNSQVVAFRGFPGYSDFYFQLENSQLVRRKRLSRHKPTCAAGLSNPISDMGSLWGSLDGFLTTSLTVGMIGGIAFSAIPILNGDAKRRNEGRLDDLHGVEAADVDDVKWGTMSVISFIPWLNWLVRLLTPLLLLDLPCCSQLT